MSTPAPAHAAWILARTAAPAFQFVFSAWGPPVHTTAAPPAVSVVVALDEPPRPVVLKSRQWPNCVCCNEPMASQRATRRWYGLCLPCYRLSTEAELDFWNNITQRWRKAALRDFGKHDIDELPVWSEDPSPIQVMLMRLAHVVGLSTPPGCEATLCEGLDRRLGVAPDVIDAAIRGRSVLPQVALERLIDGALSWLAADEAHCAAMEMEYPDHEIVDDPDDVGVLAVATVLRRELGRGH